MERQKKDTKSFEEKLFLFIFESNQSSPIPSLAASLQKSAETNKDDIRRIILLPTCEV